MAQMNKKTVSRRTELENELVGNITAQAGAMETGKDRVMDDPYSLSKFRSNRIFNISQGKRRRHPDLVLHQHAALNRDTHSAETVWEKALLHDDKRAELPQEYKPKESGMVANQMGLVTTALQNFANSKAKLTREQPTGV